MARLQALLRIRLGEGPVAARLLAMMLVALTGAAVGANGVESLFFSRFGPQFLPYLYVVLGVVTFGVMMGMSALLAAPEPTRRLVGVLLVLAGAVLAARVVLLLEARWFYPALWVVMMVIWTTQIMACWGLAGAVHDTRQAKRLFPLYGAGLILGSVTGGLATGPLAAWVGAENLLLVWAGALVATFLLGQSGAGTATTRLVRRRRRRGRRRAGLLREMAEGFRHVRGTPLLRWMSVAMILFAVLYFTLTLLFARAATERFPRTEDLAGFLGLFMAVTNGAALGASLLVANRLFARFGVPAMVLALALIYLLGFGALAVSSTFVGLIAFRFVQMLWVNAVWATGWQALFNVVSSERRASIRSFIDGGPLQAGIVLSGLLLILAERVLEARQLYLVGAGAAAMAVGAMWMARRAYGGALIEALRAGNPDVFHVDEEPFGGTRLDADARAAVILAAGDPDPAVRRVAMELLAEKPDDDGAAALRRGLSDPDPQIRATTLWALAGAPDGSAVPEITGLLADPEPSVRRPAIDALVAGSPHQDLAPPLRSLLSDRDPGVRARAAGVLLRADDHRARGELRDMAEAPDATSRAAALAELAGAGVETERVVAGLRDPDPSVRRIVASVVSSLAPERSVEPLLETLADGDPAVRDAAADALASLGPAVAGRLIDALSRPETEAGALMALVRLPGADPGVLRSYAMGQARDAARYHDLWRRIGRREARLEFAAEALRERVLRHALNALRAVTPLGDHVAMELAVENLGSRDPQQRANALEALDAVGERQIVRPLLEVWEPAAAPSENGVAVLLQLIRDEDPWLRACAAFAAGALPDDRLRSAVETVQARDPDTLVREAAARTLKGDVAVETLATLSLMDRMVALRQVPLFRELFPLDLKHVAESLTEHLFPDGAVIAEQGERGDEMHIVVSGDVRVLMGVNGEEPRDVARRGPGYTVGEMAILSEAPRMASLVAEGDVRTLSIDRRRFQRILRERPDTALAVMRELCARLREAHEHFEAGG